MCGEPSQVALQPTWGRDFFPALVQKAPRDLSMFTYDCKLPREEKESQQV